VTRLDVGSAFVVHVALGQPESATVTYDDSLADLLDVGVDGPTLRLQLKPQADVEDRATLRAEVRVRRLDQVRPSGASTVEVTGTLQDPGLRLEESGSSTVTAEVGLDRVQATLTGASRLRLTGQASTLTVAGSGSSELELGRLRAHDLDVQLSGASHADVQVDQTIAARLSGASHLTYTGTPSFTRRETSGASSIEPA
jgi:hypothetical protein